MKRVWFKAKTYGYGWYPSSWEGWALTLAYILTLLITFRIIELRSSGVDRLMEMLVPFVVLTLLLIVICYKTGEKARFRWGK